VTGCRQENQDYNIPENHARINKIHHPDQAADPKGDEDGNYLAREHAAEPSEVKCQLRHQRIYLEGTSTEGGKRSQKVQDLERDKSPARAGYLY